MDIWEDKRAMRKKWRREERESAREGGENEMERGEGEGGVTHDKVMGMEG